MCRNIGSTKYTNMSLIDKYFHEKIQIWEVRRVGDALREEIHYGPAKNQPDDHDDHERQHGHHDLHGQHDENEKHHNHHGSGFDNGD